MTTVFEKNDDSVLLGAVENVIKARTKAGLDGLAGGLEAVIIATEPDNFAPAVNELLGNTGHDVSMCFSQGDQDVCVLGLEGSADILVQSRTGVANPFLAANKGAKTSGIPNTRLETYVFKCPDVARYFDIQSKRGVRFLNDAVVSTPNYDYAQTMPSRFTGNALGFIQWKKAESDYFTPACTALDAGFKKPGKAHLKNIGDLDHVAARVRAEERDAAILEFMELTNYHFDFAVYVDFLNSITNVARLSGKDYAQVFTSGIAPFVSPETSGPTELFIYNYGPRGHHMAFNTEDIDATVSALKEGGQGFLSDVVGSRQEGLKQVFTKMSPNTLLVNEYIQRYDGFDGFFTKSNVTLLTKSTENQ